MWIFFNSKIYFHFISRSLDIFREQLASSRQHPTDHWRGNFPPFGVHAAPWRHRRGTTCLLKQLSGEEERRGDKKYFHEYFLHFFVAVVLPPRFQMLKDNKSKIFPLSSCFFLCFQALDGVRVPGEGWSGAGQWWLWWRWWIKSVFCAYEAHNC